MFIHLFSASCLSKEQVSPVRAELRIKLPFEVFREVESALVLFFAQLIALKDAQFCMHLVVENKCVNSTCIYHSPRLWGHSVGLVLVATREWFIRFCIPPKV